MIDILKKSKIVKHRPSVSSYVFRPSCPLIPLSTEDTDFSNFLSVLWDGLISLDQNRIDLKESESLFRDFLHNDDCNQNYLSELLETTFSNA